MRGVSVLSMGVAGGAVGEDGVEVRGEEEDGAGGGVFFGRELGEGVAFVIEMDVGEAEGAEVLEEPGGSGVFAEGRRGDADDLQQPSTQLRLMQVQPVKGAMDRGEAGEAGDALMGGGRHDVLCRLARFSPRLVVHFEKKEALRGSGGAGGGARPGGEDRGKSLGRGASAANVDEGSDEVADHVMQEAGAGDAVDQEVRIAVPGGGEDGSDGGLGEGGISSLPSREERSGSVAAKEVKSCVPTTDMAAFCMAARSSGQVQFQTKGASVGGQTGWGAMRYS